MNNLNKNNFHITVLKKEAVEGLCVTAGNWYIDATLGGGGHTVEILKLGGKVLGIDQDQDAINEAQNKLKDFAPDNYVLVKSNFKNIGEIVSQKQIKVAGILFDLGVSNWQLSGNNRGFSFQKDEELDMRMDKESETVKAKDLVNGLYEKELEKLIELYGEDPLARKIAREIIRVRKDKAIETTGQLREIIEHIYKQRYSSHSRINPATKTFQALRIAVNDEINNLKSALDQSIKLIEENGRIAIISFHYLEDKAIKDAFKNWESLGLGEILTQNLITPSDFEKELNPQSRSAKLRIFKKNENRK